VNVYLDKDEEKDDDHLHSFFFLDRIHGMNDVAGPKPSTISDFDAGDEDR
jgi:hypothetical protein